MNVAGIVQLALGLLNLVLGNLKSTPVTNDLQVAITGIESAIASLEAVQGTPVTYAQLEGLRVTPAWPSSPPATPPATT
jgi:hypothetical protein